jgi:E3 ubiquitin-protein ligase NRDP1
MACCPTEKEYGYEDSRFEKDVDENFHCSICYNVLKEPRMCRNNEHVYCLACISEHLKVNSQTCPECNKHLSVDTLRRPRVLNNYLSKLKINCDYASRGCPEFTCVEGLETHVANCEFAPVFCSNENCGMEINKQDQVHHETEVCAYRKVKCHDCGQTREVVGRLEGRLMELDGKGQAAEKKMENNHVEMKKIVGKLEGSLVGMNKRINEAIKNHYDEIVEASKNRHEEMKQDQHEVKKEIKDMKENLSKVNKDVDEVKVMMSQMLDKFNMLELLSKLPSPTEGMFNTPREDIVIAGGHTLHTWETTEIFSWEKNGWYEISQMNERHAGASSFIDNDQLFVVGGMFTKTIETLDLNELPLKWMEFSDKLPYQSYYHQTVVYQQRVIHIGGYNGDERKKSNVISELQLTSPCTLKELCQMPQPRGRHGAEAFEDKVLILGGIDDNDVLDSVLEFDSEKNECKELPSLPHPMKEMATVRWRDQVVVLGGRDKDGEVLNDVFMYDCKTGKITVLPSMLEKRYDCCAVITGNTIVVMGGENDDDLSSVECFTMGGCSWKYLPNMNKRRSEAVAEVLPSTRKCVYV